MSSLRSPAPRSTAPPALKSRFKFGDLLKAARHAHGFPNQTAAAERLRISRFRLWEFETSRVVPTAAERDRLFRELPILRTLADLAERLESSRDAEPAGRL